MRIIAWHGHQKSVPNRKRRNFCIFRYFQFIRLTIVSPTHIYYIQTSFSFAFYQRNWHLLYCMDDTKIHTRSISDRTQSNSSQKYSILLLLQEYFQFLVYIAIVFWLLMSTYRFYWQPSPQQYRSGNPVNDNSFDTSSFRESSVLKSMGRQSEGDEDDENDGRF